MTGNKITSIVAVSTMATALTSAPAALALDVVFINPGKSGERFWEMTSASMHAAAQDFGHSLEVLYAERDRYRMRELAEDVVARPNPPDYLVLVNEEQFAASVLPAADAAGVHTLLLLNDVVGEDRAALGEPGAALSHWIGSVIPDNYDAGRRMAEQGLAEARKLGLADANGQLSVLAIGGDKTTPAAIERHSGMTDYLAGAADARLDRMFFGRWSEDTAFEQTDRYLAAAGAAPALLWAANDAMAEGAIKALKKHGFTPGRDSVVVGLNWSPEGVALVQSGEMLMTDGGHFLGGAWAMVAVNDHHEDGAAAEIAPVIPFDMAALDSASLQHLNGMDPLTAIDKIDYQRFSRHGEDKPLPFCLSAFLKQIGVSASLSGAHGTAPSAGATEAVR